MTVHDVRRLGLEDTTGFALDLAQAIDRLAQRVHHSAKVSIADGHGKHFARTTNFLTFFDASEIAKDNNTNLAGIEVERQAQRAVSELQQLVGHASGKALDVRDSVACSPHISDLFGRRVRGLVGVDEFV